MPFCHKSEEIKKEKKKLLFIQMNCFFPQNMRQKSAKVKLYRLIGIILYLQKTPDNTHLLTPSSPMFSTIYSHSLRFNQNSIFLARFSLVSSLTFFPIF